MSSGLSAVRLGRLHRAMASYVEAGEVPGVLTLVSRRGETHFDAIGTTQMGGREPLRREAIFRIASMTKPITAAATMILVEECRIRLDEPVDRWLPELAGRRVLERIDGRLDQTVPAHRPLTVRDLLTFRLGFGMLTDLRGGGAAADWPISRAVADAGIQVLNPKQPITPDEWMRRFGALPLMHQPGERWMYHTGSDVLGVLIARASGRPFDVFLQERIFEPLGMKDTAFSVPPDKLGRLTACYRVNPQTPGCELHDDPKDSAWALPPAFPAGGGGLVSTIDDYHAFGQMMLNGGRLGKERILSRHAVEVMTTDQLTSQQKSLPGLFPGFFDNVGWGFGVSVCTKRDRVDTVQGQFGWGGAFGTSWRSDPTEQLVALLMIQCLRLMPAPAGIQADFWTSIYQAIDD
ncbi:MAG: serine hydrolase domain-containing protein [Steroidobacteraceae bacterium]